MVMRIRKKKEYVKIKAAVLHETSQEENLCDMTFNFWRLLGLLLLICAVFVYIPPSFGNDKDNKGNVSDTKIQKEEKKDITVGDKTDDLKKQKKKSEL